MEAYDITKATAKPKSHSVQYRDNIDYIISLDVLVPVGVATGKLPYAPIYSKTNLP